MKNLIYLLLVGLTSLLCGQPGYAAKDVSTWDILLKKHVVLLRGGQASQINYTGVSTDRPQLNQFLTYTSSVTQADFDRWSHQQQFAFLINTYNAWTVELILSGYPEVESIKELGSFLQSPWKKSFIPLLGEVRSLDNIEHGLIRGSGRYNDPRVHFAVNCGSIGCPALRPEAYKPEQLDQQLEDAAKAFLSDKSRNRFEGNTLKLSSIFKWYREDFEKGWRGANSLAEFILLYSSSLGLQKAESDRLRDGDIPIEFLEYDWGLNDTQGLTK